MRSFLSKSKYLNGLQCPKYLWVLFNEPEKVPEVDAATQHTFDQGHRVGELAKKLFPEGIDIPADDFTENIRQTRELLELRKPLFEAGIAAENIYCRPDILNPVCEDGWDIIEVKSSAQVKDVNIEDVSFQRFCCRKAGLKVNRCFLMHINNEYVRYGEIDPGQLFIIEDITDEVEERSAGISECVDAMHEIISSPNCPEMIIGTRCSDPYGCPLQEECWSFLPECSVFDLRGTNRKKLDLFNSGILLIKDIPEDVKLSRQQQIQKECALTGETYIQKEEINTFLATLQYPLYYLDFETIDPAIPLFDGTRPYQTIPF
ncbi:MAG: DUF2779 domain-containing protein, partial [Dehalococcoidales bacterium]|nr:DUF2779 domain-containing protein [Dehalococcoidales bacterium]